MISSIKSAALILVICTSSLALAENGKREERFKKLDTNNDGLISEAEFLARKKAKFLAADKDGNGSLDASEREQMRKDRHSRKKGKGKKRSGQAVPE